MSTTPRCSARRAEQQAAQQRMLGVVVAALIGIFLLLQAAFGSWRLATVAFVTLPVALAGGVLAAFLGGGILSLGSLFGFFTVLGIAVRNGIMLINHYQHLEQHEGEAFGPELVLRGARERLAPILMTALATGTGPAALRDFRQHSRSRDRAPDGGRHSGWPGHVDVAQPVRCTRPVLAVWGQP